MATTRLYWSDTPNPAQNLPHDTQSPASMVAGAGTRVSSYNIPRYLKVVPDQQATSTPDFAFASSGIPSNGNPNTSLHRIFVTDPVQGGFYPAGIVRMLGNLEWVFQSGSGDVVMNFIYNIYFWRPSTNSVVPTGNGTPNSNYVMAAQDDCIQSLTPFGVPTTLDTNNILGDFHTVSMTDYFDNVFQTEYGWNVNPGDVFVLEVSANFRNLTGPTTKFQYQLWYGGPNIPVVGGGGPSGTNTVISPSNPGAFIELPFTLEFLTTTPTVNPTPVKFRNMSALVGL
jgi:hypothetical protein